MLEITIVRHGKTKGNSLGRYIGTTDEELSTEGREELKKLSYDAVEHVYASPMKRCLQTAEILYPGILIEECPDFRECDFGEFENKNYQELTGNPNYQAWIDSDGKLPFPGGERVEDFKERVVNAFFQTVEEALEKNYHRIALVVHGGTIMSILERVGTPPGEYYRWQVGNGKGYVLVTEPEWWQNEKRVRLVSEQ